MSRYHTQFYTQFELVAVSFSCYCAILARCTQWVYRMTCDRLVTCDRCFFPVDCFILKLANNGMGEMKEVM